MRSVELFLIGATRGNDQTKWTTKHVDAGSPGPKQNASYIVRQ